MPIQQAPSKGSEKNGKQAGGTSYRKGLDASKSRRGPDGGGSRGKPKSPSSAAVNGRKPGVQSAPGTPRPARDASPATVLKVDIYMSRSEDSPGGAERERRGSLGSKTPGKKRKPLKSSASVGDVPSCAEQEPGPAPSSQSKPEASAESEQSKQHLPSPASAGRPAAASSSEDGPQPERRRTRSFGKKPEGEPDRQQQQHTVTVVQGARLQSSVFTVSKPTVTSLVSLPPKPKDVDLNLKAKSVDDTGSADACTNEQPIHKGNTASKISLFENKSVSHSQRQIDFPATKNLSVQKKYVGRAKLTFGKQSKDNEQLERSTNKQDSDEESLRNGSPTVAEIKLSFEEASKTKTSEVLEAGRGMGLKKKEKTLLSQVNQVPRPDNSADASALQLAGTEPSMVNKDSTMPVAAPSPQNSDSVLPENNQKYSVSVSKPSESIKHKMVRESVSSLHEVDSPQVADMSPEGNPSKQKDDVKFNGQKVLQLTENSVQPPEHSKKAQVKLPNRKAGKSSESRTDGIQANQFCEAELCAVQENISDLHPMEFTKNGKTKPSEDVWPAICDEDEPPVVPLVAADEQTPLKTTAEWPDGGQAHIIPLADAKSMQAIEAANEAQTNKTIMKSPKKKTERRSAGSEGVKQVPAVEQNSTLENTHLFQLLEPDTSVRSSEQTKALDVAAEERDLSEFNNKGTQDGGEHCTPLQMEHKPDIPQEAALKTLLNQSSSRSSANALKESSKNTDLQQVSSTKPKDKQILDPLLSQNVPESVPAQQEADLDRSSPGPVSIMNPNKAKVFSEKAASQSTKDNSLEALAATHCASSSEAKQHSDLLVHNSQQDTAKVQPNEGKKSLLSFQNDKRKNLPLEDGIHSTISRHRSYENIFDASEQNKVLLNNLPSGENEIASFQSNSILTLEKETHNGQETATEINLSLAPASHMEDNAPPVDSHLKSVAQSTQLNSWTQNADVEMLMSKSYANKSLYMNGSLENNLLFGQNVWGSPQSSENMFNLSGASDDSSLDSSSDMERFTEIIRKLDSPATVPQKRKKQRPARPPLPSFGLPPIREDYLEKIFDADGFTCGLGKKDRSQDIAPALLLKMQNSELPSRLQPKRSSKEQSIVFQSLRPSKNNEALATEQIDGKENDTGAVEIKRSRLENSKIFSSLQASSKPKSHENIFLPSITSISDVMTSFTVSQNDSISARTAEIPTTNCSNGTLHMSASVQENGNPDMKPGVFSKASENSTLDPLNPSLTAVKDSSCIEDGLQTQEVELEQKRGVHLPENRSYELPKSDGIPKASDGRNVYNTRESTDTPQMPSNGSSETDMPSTFPSSNYGSDFPLLAPDAEMFLGRNEKINPRPGKVVICSEPNLCGTVLEVYSDVPDCTSWELSPEISIRVVRGCWLLYEKPDFEGLSIPLEEGEMELTNLWGENTREEDNAAPAVIGSLRQVVKDYRICQIDLFTEPDGLGLVTSYFDDTEDIQGYGTLQKTCSIKVHWGTWLIYEESGFQGIPFILEPGEYPDLSFWDTHEAYIGSMRPMKMGGHKVEIPNEPKIIVYEKPFFEGRELELEGEVFRFEVDREEEHGENEPSEAQKAPFTTVGSMRVLGGVWVAYEKPGFEGHQYLLEEGDYQEWCDWGGNDEQLQSLRPIFADFSAPHIIMYTEKNFGDKGSNINVLGIVSNLDDTGYGLKTQSINVLSGVWVAYEGPDFTGEQYILEKGMYPTFEDWGAKNCRISSIQPVVLDSASSPRGRFKVQLFSKPEFKGTSEIFEESKKEIEPFAVKSCKVLAGSWVAFDEEGFSGNQFVLEEGAYPDMCALGCKCDTNFQSLQTIDFEFSEPSIVLYGKENYKGKKVEVVGETVSLQALGYSPHTASLQVLGGIWIVYEYSHYRGRQKLLLPSSIPQWYVLSSWQSIGSLRPLIQKRPYFRIRNQGTGMFMSCAGSLEDLKLLRIHVTEETGGEEQIWLYQNGFIKCLIAEECCLAPSGSFIAVGSKLGLSLEQKDENQCWSISPDSKIYCRLKPNFVLDIKGGVQYDQKHVILNTASEDKPTQCWELLIL